MLWNTINGVGSRNWARNLTWIAVLGVFLLLLAACGSDEGNTSISPTTEAATLTPANLQNPGTDDKPDQVSTPFPELSPADPVVLKILAPQHGSGVEVGAVQVMGITSGTKITINGVPVAVAADGSFQRDLPLAEGLNMVEVVATAPPGRTASQKLAVFSISPIAGLPFSLFYPPDGLTVNQPFVSILGATTPDAIVGVNDTPVDVNALGIFSSTVDLAEGPNLVQVVATDIVGNIRFQTVAIFYTP